MDSAMADRAKVLYIAHGHPDFSPGGGELAALHMFNSMRDSPRYEPFFLAAIDAPHGTRRLLFRHEAREATYLLAPGDPGPDVFFQTGRDLHPLTEYLRELK